MGQRREHTLQALHWFFVHMSSVWVPFTSEAKEAIVAYPEIIHEMKLGLQEVGRQLGIYIRKNIRAESRGTRAICLKITYLRFLLIHLQGLVAQRKQILQKH